MSNVLTKAVYRQKSEIDKILGSAFVELSVTKRLVQTLEAGLIRIDSQENHA